MDLICKDECWQIHGKCYRVLTGKHTWKDAVKQCKNQGLDRELKPQVANFYAQTMSIYLNEMIDIYDAWVFVPNLKDYFVNGEGNAAIYVQDGAYKYDVKPGTILMDDPNNKHQVICEYTAAMTMAEMYYIGKVYSEIYPIHVYDNGAIIPSANVMTVQQTGLFDVKDTANYGGKAEKFTTDNLAKACDSIGNILNVHSFPMTAIEEEFDDVKDLLTDQRFFLTSRTR